MKIFAEILLIIQLVVFIDAESSNTIDGGWSDWSFYPSRPCSVSCGGGTEVRERLCQNPQPQNGGKECEGESEKVVDCNVQTCITDGVDSLWADWQPCSVDCGRGVQRRYRECISEKTCLKTTITVEQRHCNTWNKTRCPDPCLEKPCPEGAACTDMSTELDKAFKCECVMGRQLTQDKKKCIPKPEPTTTERPIPTLTAEEKQVSVVITKTASTILLVFVGITLGAFLILRIFTTDRIIQMSMEISLFVAHLLLLIPYSAVEDQPMVCRWIAIGLHYFFTACFTFMFLESLHMYSLVAFVVPKDGLMGKLPNALIGWCAPGFVIMFSLCFHYSEYGGEYHCWLDWNRVIVYAEMVPILLLSLLTLILTEAAGAADFKQLPDYSRTELFSAKISQRSNLILLPLILSSWIIGFLSEYEQNIGLYSTFSILNAVIGVAVFFFHCTGNEKVREKLKHVFSCCISAVKSK